MSRLIGAGLLVMTVSSPVMADAMSDFQSGSGFGGTVSSNLFSSLLLGVVALYGVWAIGTAVWSWTQGSMPPMHVFFVVFRSALVLTMTSLMVGFLS